MWSCYNIQEEAGGGRDTPGPFCGVRVWAITGQLGEQALLPSPDASIAIRILAGCTTGAMAVTCAQPTDVVKVRFQASTRLGPESDRKYSGTMDAYRTIAKEEGIRGLWKGRLREPQAGHRAGRELPE